MKKLLILFISSILFFSFGFDINNPTTTNLSVDTTKEITKLSFSEYGNKYYLVGEDFNPDGYKIKVEYIDGSYNEYSLDTTPIEYEIKYNKLYVSLENHKISYQLNYGFTEDDWLKSEYFLYPMYYAYQRNDSFIIELDNEESLKNKAYTLDDFQGLNITSFEEITIERWKDIKLEEDRDKFHRFFIIYFDPENISSRASAIESKTTIASFYYMNNTYY